MTEQDLAEMAIEERNAYLDQLDEEQDDLFPDWDLWTELADDARMGN